jgi:hypothetical protein
MIKRKGGKGATNLFQANVPKLLWKNYEKLQMPPFIFGSSQGSNSIPSPYVIW